MVVPSTAYNAKGLTIAAIRDDGPVVMLEHKFLGAAAKGPVPEEAYCVPIGKAEIVRRGRDVTLCGIGRMTHVCLEAADTLAAEGIKARSRGRADAWRRSTRRTILESVARTHRWSW